MYRNRLGDIAETVLGLNLFMNGFIFVVILVVGAFSSSALRKTDKVVLVEIDGAYVILIVIVPVIINTAFA